MIFVESPTRKVEFVVTTAGLWDQAALTASFERAGVDAPLPKQASAYSEWVKKLLGALHRRKGEYREAIMDVLEGMNIEERGADGIAQLVSGTITAARGKLFLSPKAFLAVCKSVSEEISGHDTSEVLRDAGWSRSTVWNPETQLPYAVWTKKAGKMALEAVKPPSVEPTPPPLGPNEEVDFADFDLEFAP